ncbi:putative calmodulin-binding protein 25 [Iris pallida]|uniref:Calmodulin-binding protein 25 n=1 Tax=Iris pallida TaxID=29817 RepID=A0AAX6HZJ9_IRIPA|nr:putative calmodulin-binding protein 25 [Iris pallida]KAJ6846258.1 putative calmodulin-binding protein 25 [Iris pallida]
MASENCMSIMDSWSYRPSLPETLWMSEAFARDNDALTRALQASFSTSETLTHTQIQPQQQPDVDVVVVAAADNSSNKQRSFMLRSNRADPATAITGKVSKRKSRASKKSPTTYINADPANFRQMVQQVTGGVRFPLDPVLLLKPEPQRAAAGGLSHHRAGAVLPTLDTSALLMRDADAASFSSAFSGAAGGYAPVGPAEGDAGSVSGSRSGSGSGSAYGFDAFSSFPTLESWGGM